MMRALALLPLLLGACTAQQIAATVPAATEAAVCGLAVAAVVEAGHQAGASDGQLAINSANAALADPACKAALLATAQAVQVAAQ